LTDCLDPVQRLAVTTLPPRAVRRGEPLPARGALVLLLETDASSTDFHARPRRFVLPAGSGVLGGCCEQPTGDGSGLVFRDHARNFYAFVYVGRAAASKRDGALAVLDSLRVRPRAA
jgi:hypothetical protein